MTLFAKPIKTSLAILTCSLMVSTALAQSPEEIAQYISDPVLKQQLQEFSNESALAEPEVRQIMNAQGVDYLYELNPNMFYTLDTSTGAVTISTDPGFLVIEDDIVAQADPFFGLGFTPTALKSAGLYINGQAATAITCFSAAKTVNVSAIQASQVSRDPFVGRKSGTPTDLSGFTIGTRVDTSTLKVAGGAKNPLNRTVLESLHTGSCGGEVKMRTKFTNWPKKWASLNIDDTGSMHAEIGGVRTALASFIDGQGVPDDGDDPFVTYSLTTFKDSPTLKLARTADTDAAKLAVNALTASGGADCPEESLGAINMSLDRISSNNDEDTKAEIVLVTNASPHNGDIDSIISTANSQGVSVNVMLSGDCAATSAASADSITTASHVLSSREVFSRIARETGGIYVFEPGGTEQDYTDILERIFARITSTGTDIEPPVVTVNLMRETIWPPNHEMILLAPTVSALDNEDLNPAIELVSVTSSEPDNGQGDGSTEDDIEIGEDGSIYVRAERSGTGDMRIYTITYKAIDASGNEGFGSADVIVPHDN